MTFAEKWLKSIKSLDGKIFTLKAEGISLAFILLDQVVPTSLDIGELSFSHIEPIRRSSDAEA